MQPIEPITPMSPRPRGAIPTPRHLLAAAMPFRTSDVPPPQVAMVPQQLSYWNNNKYGCCVSTEEAFAIAAYSTLMGLPEIFISDQVVYNFAQRNGLLNGANLLPVIQLMQHQGMIQNGQKYTDGQPSSVNWHNESLLQNAISKGPVKIACAADQLERVVGSHNGWLGLDFKPDGNIDHCTSLSGYGPLGWLAQQLGNNPPPNVNQDMMAYLFFTWKTIGIVTHQSIVNITGEAWLRTPTTQGLPTPPPPVWPGWNV